jgi:hypothetical protein
MLNVDCVVVNSVSFEMSGILNFYKCELKKSAEGRGGGGGGCVCSSAHANAR